MRMRMEIRRRRRRRVGEGERGGFRSVVGDAGGAHLFLFCVCLGVGAWVGGCVCGWVGVCVREGGREGGRVGGWDCVGGERGVGEREGKGGSKQGEGVGVRRS